MHECAALLADVGLNHTHTCRKTAAPAVSPYDCVVPVPAFGVTELAVTTDGTRSYPMTSSAVNSMLIAGFAPGKPDSSCTFRGTPVRRGLLCQSPKSPPSFRLLNSAKAVWASIEK